MTNEEEFAIPDVSAVVDDDQSPPSWMLSIGRCFKCGATVRPGEGDWCPCIKVSREEWAAAQAAMRSTRVTIVDDEPYRAGRKLREDY